MINLLIIALSALSCWAN